ncbi:hypothetical protein Scep_014866 [Stephania cephalantha]|uniref:Uncharacterized protein n=1 Tax=Stephania cephalantha TaxID=152367 RepID=A0AAP0J2U8_9MAGN
MCCADPEAVNRGLQGLCEMMTWQQIVIEMCANKVDEERENQELMMSKKIRNKIWDMHEKGIEMCANKIKPSSNKEEAEKEVEVILEWPYEPYEEMKEDQPLVLMNPPPISLILVEFETRMEHKGHLKILCGVDNYVLDGQDYMNTYALEVQDELKILKEGMPISLPKAMANPLRKVLKRRKKKVRYVGIRIVLEMCANNVDEEQEKSGVEYGICIRNRSLVTYFIEESLPSRLGHLR